MPLQTPPPDAPPYGALPQHRKRRKTRAASFFAGSDSEESEDSESEEQGQVDELSAYLALPQIKYKTDVGAPSPHTTEKAQQQQHAALAQRPAGMESAGL